MAGPPELKRRRAGGGYATALPPCGIAALITVAPTIAVWISSHYKATCARIEDMKQSFAATVWREDEPARRKRTALGGRTRLQEGTF